VTHDEAHALLGSYAAGTLDDDASEAVRAHLTAGCLDCLREVFGRPVGLPRAAPSIPPSPPAVTVTRPRVGPVAAVAILALALAALGGWTIVDLQASIATARARSRDLESRLDDAETARLALAARMDALERQAAAAGEEAARAASRAQEIGEDRGRLAEDLQATQDRLDAVTRDLRRRSREAQRLRLGLDGRDAVDGLLGSPDLQVLPLQPVAPFRDVRGHALAAPGSNMLALYALGLPPAPVGAHYRVRIGLDDGREIPGPALVPDHAPAVLHLDTPPTTIRTIDVILEPAGRPILTWRRS
jgi:hypothetical protein